MSYKIYSVEGNRQRLDGGSMFGNVPYALWSRWVTPDEQMRIPLACRSFLIVDETIPRTILLESGIGAFFEPKLRRRFGVEEEQHVLLDNLAALGVAPKEIDLVVLSHLHFDHAGGLLSSWQEGVDPTLAFPKAYFIVNRTVWERARAPHKRDRASFIPPLHTLLEQSDRLELVDDNLDKLGEGWSCSTSDGHTPGMMLTQLRTDKGTVAFCGDLIPGTPWVHLPVTMGYDRYPELLIDEKERFLNDALKNDTTLLFTHDASTAAAKVQRDDKGRFSPRDLQAKLDGLAL